jgi:hypothetical protein
VPRLWEAACNRAGLPGRLVHDFRRTAVRNLERAGVPRSVAMKLVGHKTEAVYRRYAIVAEGDLKAGAERLAALHAALAETPRTVVPLGGVENPHRAGTVSATGSQTERAGSRQSGEMTQGRWRRGSESNRRMKDLQGPQGSGLPSPEETEGRGTCDLAAPTCAAPGTPGSSVSPAPAQNPHSGASGRRGGS